MATPVFVLRVTPNRLVFLLLCAISILTTLHLLQRYHSTPQVNVIYVKKGAKLDSRLIDLLASSDDIVRDIQKTLPYLTLSTWRKYQNEFLLHKNKTCAKLPTVYDLVYHNQYWQLLRTTNGTFYLLRAYYDARKLNPVGPLVRVLCMIDRYELNITTFCQLWFAEHDKPVVVQTTEYILQFWKNDFNYYTTNSIHYVPYLLTCPIPKNFHNRVPLFVSVVERICDTSSNSLSIVYEKVERKKRFGVCVKTLSYIKEDISVKFVEWIELAKLLGADKVYIGVLELHENITNVLNYYSRRNMVEVTPYTLVGSQPNVPQLRHLYTYRKKPVKWINEMVSITDCFYKNMHRYEYIAIIDPDEMIIPIEKASWADLIDTVSEEALSEAGATPPATYCAIVTNFPADCDSFMEDIPPYMHMLQHTYRLETLYRPGWNVKCFHQTERVLTAHNHRQINCLTEDCLSYDINTEQARLFHYRAADPDLNRSCANIEHKLINDTTIWRYKERLIDRTLRTLYELGYFHKSTVKRN